MPMIVVNNFVFLKPPVIGAIYLWVTQRRSRRSQHKTNRIATSRSRNSRKSFNSFCNGFHVTRRELIARCSWVVAVHCYSNTGFITSNGKRINQGSEEFLLFAKVQVTYTIWAIERKHDIHLIRASCMNDMLMVMVFIKIKSLHRS